MKNKRIIILTLIIFIALISALFITYGYLSVRITGNETSKKAVFSSQILKVEYSDGTESLISKQNNYFIPGSVLTKTFTIKNTGNVPAKYSINLTNINNDFNRPEDLYYEIKENDTILSEGTFPQSDTYIVSKELLNVDEEKTYTLTVSYLTSEENQIIDQGKIINANVTIADTVRTIKKLNIYGNSIQDGTPTPTNPIEIESLGNKTKNLFNVNKFVELVKKYDSTAEEVIVDGRRCILIQIRSLYHKDFSSVANFETNKQYVWKMDIKHVEGLEGDYSDTLFLGYIYEGEDYSSTNIASTGALTHYKNNYKEFTTSKSIISTLGKNVSQIGFSFGRNSKWLIDLDSVQIEEGTTATEYEPYGYKIPITSGGKNLIENVNPDVETINGITYTKNSDGSITMNGTSTAISTYPINSITSYVGMTTKLDGNTTYILSSETPLPTNVYLQAFGHVNGSVVYKTAFKERSITFTTSEETTWGFYIKVESGVTIDNVTVYPQLEIGSVATSYEPFVSLPTTYNIYLDEPLRKVGNCDTCSDYIDFANGQVVRNTYGANVSLSTLQSFSEARYSLTSILRYTNSSYTMYTPRFVNNYLQVGNAIDTMGSYEAKYAQSENIHWLLSTSYGQLIAPTDMTIGEFFTENASLYPNGWSFWYVLQNPITNSIDIPDIDLVQRLSNNINVCSNNGVCASNIEIEYDE